ncbi:hypothetical protein TRVL_04704 [Trypanosoma vivax]|nr:hypothetical protein TRVL_04704 [Trypanosoma vivax]
MLVAAPFRCEASPYPWMLLPVVSPTIPPRLPLLSSLCASAASGVLSPHLFHFPTASRHLTPQYFLVLSAQRLVTKVPVEPCAGPLHHSLAIRTGIASDVAHEMHLFL